MAWSPFSPSMCVARRAPEASPRPGPPDAKRGDAELAVSLLEHVQEVQDDAGAARADRVAEAYTTAIDVEPLARDLAERSRETELGAAITLVRHGREAGQDLGGEGLVDLPVSDLMDTESVALEERRHGVYRTEAHLARVQARPLAVHDASHDLQAVRLYGLFARDDQEAAPSVTWALLPAVTLP